MADNDREFTSEQFDEARKLGQSLSAIAFRRMGLDRKGGFAAFEAEQSRIYSLALEMMLAQFLAGNIMAGGVLEDILKAHESNVRRLTANFLVASRDPEGVFN